MLKELIKRHEGLSLTPYKDTQGILTIGYGYNLEQGIDEETADYLLDKMLREASIDCHSLFPYFPELNTVRQAVLMNMMYNLGKTRLSRFRRMRAALLTCEFKKASLEMLDSRWATQVGNRAIELAKLMSEGHE